MDAFIGNLTRINSVGETLSLFEVFAMTPWIKKYDTASIMDAFPFEGYI